MATFSLTTTAAQDAGIAFALAQENARRAAQSPALPALTAGQYLNQLFDGWCASYVEQAKASDIEEIRATYVSAPASQRAAAKQAALEALR